jgi:hypothetical protein
MAAPLSLFSFGRDLPGPFVPANAVPEAKGPDAGNFNTRFALTAKAGHGNERAGAL